MATNETWTRQAAEIECNRRKWEHYDATFHGYKRKNQKFPLRYDFMGCIDMLAWPEKDRHVSVPGQLKLIQFCAWGDISKRRKKIMAHPKVISFAWAIGADILIWGFRDRSGERQLKEEEIH